MKNIDVTIVQGDDWVGFYINKELVMQDHSLDIYDILSELCGEGQIGSVTKLYPNEEWLDETSYFPENLDDVQL